MTSEINELHTMRVAQEPSPARLAAVKASEQFAAIFTPDLRKILSGITINDFREEFLRLERLLAARGTEMGMSRLEPLIDWMETHAKFIDKFLHGTSMVPWIWAPVTLVLTITSDYREAFQAMIGAYSKLARILPHFGQWIDAILQIQNIEELISSLYVKILEFHTIFCRFFQQKLWKQLFHAVWSDLEKRFEAKLNDIHSYAQLLIHKIETDLQFGLALEKPLHDRVDIYKETAVVGSKYEVSENTFAGMLTFAEYNDSGNSKQKFPHEDPLDVIVRSISSRNDNNTKEWKTADAREPGQQRLMENGVAQFLAGNASLRSLQEAALQLLPRDRHYNNFRRLFDHFCDDLPKSLADPHASAASRDLADCLRQADARIRIVTVVMKEVVPYDDFLGRDMPMFRISSKSSRHYLIAEALIPGQVFQNLILDFQQLLLPNGLLKELLPIPESDISFEPPSKSASINTIQGWFEKVTAVDWDWWPLSPWLPPLEHDETRVFWKCACGKMRWRVLKNAQREILQDALSSHPEPVTEDTPKDHPARLLRQPLCASLRPWRSQSGMAGEAQPSPDPTSSPQTQGQSQYFRSMFEDLLSFIRNFGKTGMPSQGSNTITGVDASSTPNQDQGNGRWLAFGVWGSQITVDLDQVDKHTLASDKLFLAEIKRRHDTMRGWVRLYFTFWRLSYWEFVKFTRLHGRYSAHTIELPTAPEYEYEPRPPEPPGVSRDTFEHLVSACIQPCWMRKIHTCWTIEDHEAELVGYLPKRQSEFEFSRQSPRDKIFWGLEARYRVVAWRILVIHLAILAISFGLWGWWQRNHPNDLQGASTPLTVALLMTSGFWSTTGILEPLRQQKLKSS